MTWGFWWMRVYMWWKIFGRRLGGTYARGRRAEIFPKSRHFSTTRRVVIHIPKRGLKLAGRDCGADLHEIPAHIGVRLQEPLDAAESVQHRRVVAAAQQSPDLCVRLVGEVAE
jgi:hypothetical protein